MKNPDFLYITDLSCSSCGKSFSARKVNPYCLDCNAPLISNDDLGSTLHHLDGDEIRQRSSTMQRWYELLPVFGPRLRVSLGEGDKALL